MEVYCEVQNAAETAELFGSCDFNVKIIERELDVKIANREDAIKITGSEGDCAVASCALNGLLNMLRAGEEINEQSVRYALSLAHDGKEMPTAKKGDYICLTANGRPVKWKTDGQKTYVESIRKNTIVFSIGPAGTGKTYLAVAMAVDAFRRKEVSRIILTRPAVEAGEKLGFLPGDLQTKVDPYLRPLHDALSEMLGFENYRTYTERGSIEVAPLAYMRGRTLDDAFIILDEAQNTTPEQMKMFLTRIGFGSRAIVTGDVTQIDLPDGKRSGLRDAARILKNIEGIGFCTLTGRDVVRHPLIQKIIAAYERGADKPKGERR